MIMLNSHTKEEDVEAEDKFSLLLKNVYCWK